MIKKESLWTGPYILILLAAALQNLQNQMVGPIMSRFSRDSGIALSLTGFIVGVFSVSALITRPVSGMLADKLSNRWLSFSGCLLTALASLGYGLIGGNIVPLMLLRFIHGLGFGLSGTTLMRMASTVIPGTRMGEGMGYFGLGQVLSMGIAPPISLWLIEKAGYSPAFFTGAALVLLSAVLCLFAKLPKVKNAYKKEIGFSAFFRLPKKIIALCFTACTLFFANSLESNFILIYEDNLGISSLSLYFSVSALAMLGVRLFCGRLLDKLSPKRLLLPALSLVCLSMLMLCAGGLVPGQYSFSLLIAAAFVKGLGHAAAQPGIQAACLQGVREDSRGLASGCFYMGSDLGMALGPIVGGWLAGILGYPAIYITGAAVVALGFWGVLFRPKAERH